MAAVPEGLPPCSRWPSLSGSSAWRAIGPDVRRLSAVEALGSVTVIATDKTGTLTLNRMDLRAIDAPDPARALEAIGTRQRCLAGFGDAGASTVGRPAEPSHSPPYEGTPVVTNAWRIEDRDPRRPSMIRFLVHWLVVALGLAAAAYLVPGVSISSGTALAFGALVLGFANAVVRPGDDPVDPAAHAPRPSDCSIWS